MTNIPRSEFQSELTSLGKQQFTELIAELWELDGWKTQLTGAAEENAIDIIAVKDKLFKRKEIIHIKQVGLNEIVTASAVSSCNSSRHYQQSTDSGVLITNAGFTNDAKLLADDLNVKIVSSDTLYDHLTECNRFEYFYDYI